ncbi:acetate--CoA ligase family protein [Amorphoplanes digitatis]|uniref:Acetyltransferase n=3 Tax=Actinoplanes digitatis TaxID=1868 RepID=A0A7W7I287_9ACTN|nr:acetate--CoA ligase family protein [Actinoplanes digitatis]MBB4765085.1 acetyltransferase [Actinoplanes digitatis]GID97650.1 acetyl-CoA synthetase [Actinoplanes digitatis]
MTTDARDVRPGTADAGPSARLRPLFAPRGVVVVGASRDSSKLGAVMARSLSAFPGPVAGVNPRDVAPDERRYAAVADAADALGVPLDLAVLCVPAAASAGALTAAAAGGVRAALVCAGGYAEAGGPGIGYQRDLVDAARRSEVVLLGPNTSGFIAPARGLTASFVPGVGAVPAGSVAVVAASGGVNHALAFMLAEAGIGVSLAVGLGNAVDVTAADVLTYLLDDPATRAVALHVESVADGPALASAVEALCARVPVVALVVGRNDVADFARSHTGALATSWRVTRAALRQAGAVVVDDERALVDAVTALSLIRLPAASRPGVAVVTAQAGPGLLHADGLAGTGVHVPTLAGDTRDRLSALLPALTYQANPVDTGRPGETFPGVLAAVAADPAIDVVSVYALAEPDSLDLPAAFAAAGSMAALVATGGPATEVAAIRDALLPLGIPTLSSPAALTTAVTALVHDAQARARAAGRLRQPSTPAESDPRVRDALARTEFDEDAAKALLGILGIGTLARAACDSRDEAHAALIALGGPVVVKLLDAAVVHKSDISGVHLGIRDPAELDRALDALHAAGAQRFLVEKQAGPGIDLIVGATRDPVFGPVVLVGLGGVLAEALADVATAPAPLFASEAAELLDELVGRALLDGFRGGPFVDRGAVGRILAVLGDLLVADGRLESVEINPLRITADGILALDAVVSFEEVP